MSNNHSDVFDHALKAHYMPGIKFPIIYFLIASGIGQDYDPIFHLSDWFKATQLIRAELGFGLWFLWLQILLSISCLPRPSPRPLLPWVT